MDEYKKHKQFATEIVIVSEWNMGLFVENENGKLDTAD